jgi:hypothetical protein
MTDFSIVAILVGVATTFTMQNWLNRHWYISVSLGVVGYLVARFLGWAINKRQRHNREKQRNPVVK